MTSNETPDDKQVTVAVPANRVPEFYAFYAHFLTGSRRGPKGRRGGPRHHRRCAHRDATDPSPTQPESAA